MPSTFNPTAVATEHGDLKVEFNDGSSHATELQLRQVVMGVKDPIHQLTNVGDKGYTSVIIELKD